MTHGVLVVGLGQIGMGYDFALGEEWSLTHARAFAQHPAFQLLGGVDPDAARREQFEQRYGGRTFADLPAALAALRPSIVAVATPTSVHAQTVQAVLDHGAPAVLLCEKPLSVDLAEARAMVETCKQRGCELFVNYIRRSEPGVAEISRRLREGAIALPAKGVAWYSKGLFNNGSHFLNLLQTWLGEVQSTQVIRAGRLWGGVDPEPDFTVTFADGEVTFLAAREENFSHYTVELVAPNGRLRYEQGGERILWQKAAADPAYPGYTTLQADGETLGTDYARTQWHVTDQLATHLEGRPARLCSGAEALRTLETLTAIRTET